MSDLAPSLGREDVAVSASSDGLAPLLLRFGDSVGLFASLPFMFSLSGSPIIGFLRCVCGVCACVTTWVWLFADHVPQLVSKEFRPIMPSWFVGGVESLAFCKSLFVSRVLFPIWARSVSER